MKYINNLKSKTGIYIITNDIDARIYIGSATSFKQRYATHRNKIMLNENCNPKLRNFANKYGIERLTFSAVHACCKEDLLKVEQMYLDVFQPFDDNGFNIVRKAGSPIGYKHTQEAKDKMKGRLGPRWNEEQKKYFSEIKKGIPAKDGMKKKLREHYVDITKSVMVYNQDGFVAEYPSAMEASIQMGVPKNLIKSSVRNKNKTANGLVFIYKENVTENIDDEIKRRYNNDCIKPLIVTDVISGETFNTNSVTELCKIINSKPPSIVSAIKKSRLLYGRYKISYK
ncbi:MAG: GIY-YIG nuclease family protein [Anaerotignaceae bacterium]